MSTPKYSWKYSEGGSHHRQRMLSREGRTGLAHEGGNSGLCAAELWSSGEMLVLLLAPATCSCLLSGFPRRAQQHHRQEGDWRTLDGEPVGARGPGTQVRGSWAALQFLAGTTRARVHHGVGNHRPTAYTVRLEDTVSVCEKITSVRPTGREMHN